MYNYYYFEGKVYKTLQEAHKATKNYINKRIDIIKSYVDFETFQNCFETLQLQGECDTCALEFASIGEF